MTFATSLFTLVHMKRFTTDPLAVATAGVVPLLMFAVDIPSVDMTSPKFFLGLCASTLLMAAYSLYLLRSRPHETATDPTAATGCSRPISGQWILSLLFVMNLIWLAVSLAGQPIITHEITRILPGMGVALFWWYTGVTRKQQQVVFSVVAGAGWMMALGGIAQFAGLDPVPWQYSFQEGVFSFMGHPNILAPCLVMALAGQAAAGTATVSRYGRWVWWSMIPVTLLALLLTKSKGAWAGAVLSLAMSSLCLGRRQVRRTALTIITVLLMVAGVFLIGHGSSRGQFLSDLALRPAIWKSSLNMIDSPVRLLIGRGPGTWFIHFPASRGASFLHRFRRTENIRHAHNEYIEQITESGVIGTALFLCLTAGFFFDVIRTRNSRRLTPYEITAFWAVPAVLFHAAVSINLRGFALWTVFWIFWAFSRESGQATPARSSDVLVRPLNHSPRSLLLNRSVPRAGVVSLLLLTGIVSAAGVIPAFGSMRSASDQYQGRVRMGGVDGDAAVAFLTRAADRNPLNLDARYDLAVSLFESGRYGDAERTFDAVRLIAPDFQRIHMNRTILYLEGGRRDNRPELFARALAAIQRELLLNDVDENHYLLGAVEAALGDDVAARDAFEAFLVRMDRNRDDLNRLGQLRGAESVALVRPKNWEMLEQMEDAARKWMIDNRWLRSPTE
ncbi:O-antigen ligase family protein [bacterium]|nr:O-antigen ligase family protein [candidate division CSSED10-310 bacterium]